MKNITHDNNASAVPIILFLVTILGCGLFYTLLFLEIFFPSIAYLVEGSDSRVFIMMCFYAIPLFVIIIGVISLLKAGLKRYDYEVLQR